MGYIVKLVCRAAGVGSDEAPCFRRATVEHAVGDWCENTEASLNNELKVTETPLQRMLLNVAWQS